MRATVTRLKMESARARQSNPAPQLALLPGSRTVALCRCSVGCSSKLWTIRLITSRTIDDPFLVQRCFDCLALIGG